MVAALPLRTLPVALLVALAAMAFSAPFVPAGSPTTPFVVGVDVMPASRGRFHGETVVASDDGLRYLLVQARNPHAFQARAERDPNVRYVEEDREDVHALFTPNDALYASRQYDLKPPTTNISGAWGTTLGSTAVKVCVVDTGLYAAHEDFAGLALGGFKDFVNGRTTAYDDNGHGTHVTGTLAARTDNGKGVAGIAQVTVYSAKVLAKSGSGTFTQVANGFKWCADQGAHVLSASLGASSGASVLADAVAYADAKGVLQVAAAGNSGPCTDCVSYPAAYPVVVAVSCTDQTNALCSFSSTGPQVDFAAPGKSITSAWPKKVSPCRPFHGDACYVVASGTSMSAPHVAGLAALVKSANATATKDAMVEALRSAALDLGPVGWDAQFGWGLIQGRAV